MYIIRLGSEILLTQTQPQRLSQDFSTQRDPFGEIASAK